jgi:hypothetical protein
MSPRRLIDALGALGFSAFVGAQGCGGNHHTAGSGSSIEPGDTGASGSSGAPSGAATGTSEAGSGVAESGTTSGASGISDASMCDAGTSDAGCDLCATDPLFTCCPPGQTCACVPYDNSAVSALHAPPLP